jgi:hypothetical protein
LRNPAEGGAAGSRTCGWTNAALWSIPITPATVGASDDGTVSSVAGARSVKPFTVYSLRVVANAAST